MPGSSAMQIAERIVGDVTILDLDGQDDARRGRRVSAARTRSAACSPTGTRKLVLNLEGVPYIDSGRPRRNRAHPHDGEASRAARLKLLNLTKRIQDLLSITKLTDGLRHLRQRKPTPSRASRRSRPAAARPLDHLPMARPNLPASSTCARRFEQPARKRRPRTLRSLMYVSAATAASGPRTSSSSPPCLFGRQLLRSRRRRPWPLADVRRVLRPVRASVYLVNDLYGSRRRPASTPRSGMRPIASRRPLACADSAIVWAGRRRHRRPRSAARVVRRPRRLRRSPRRRISRSSSLYSRWTHQTSSSSSTC
jgi:anti-sigma B factor antagonist